MRTDIFRKKAQLPVFLVWPFFGFLWSLLTYKSNTSKVLVYIFLVFYGLTFVITGPGPDAYEYAQGLIDTAQRPFNEIWDVIGGMYATNTSVDIVQPIITFFVSRVTDHHFLLFGVFAAIFGYFYLKSIDFVYDQYIENPNTNVLIHVLFFALINPICNINGFRFNAAVWVYFFGAFNFILYRNPKYLFIALSSLLLHFSFIGASIILLIYFFLGNRDKIYVPILILSFIIPDLLKPYLDQIIPKLGLGLQTRIQGYTSESYVMGTTVLIKSVKWIIQSSGDFVMYYLFGAILYMKFRFRAISSDKQISSLYSFLLLFLSFINFGKSIPSFGRFQMVFMLLGVLYLILILIRIPVKKGLPITLIGLFPMILMALISLRIWANSFNVLLLAPMPLPFINNSISFASFFF